MVTRLQVTYTSPEIDEELDKKILEFFNKLDFICINREYNHLTLTRGLSFERQTNEETAKEARAKGKDIITEGMRYGSKRDKEAQLTA